MSTFNLKHMRNGREKLKGFWGLAFAVSLVFGLLSGLPGNVGPEWGSVVSLVITGPLSLGFTIFALNIYRSNNGTFNDLFEGFKNFGKSLLVYLLTIIVVVIGMILLIVPGIIAGLGLSMSYFVMVDKPELSAVETLKESWKLMKGYKTKYLGLCIRFIPWFVLGVVTLGIGLFFVIGWIQVASASFYEQIKAEPIS